MGTENRNSQWKLSDCLMKVIIVIFVPKCTAGSFHSVSSKHFNIVVTIINIMKQSTKF